MSEFFNKCWNYRFGKIILLATILVSSLGYLDKITGEISIDILYLLCIGLVAWYTNIFGGLIIVTEVAIVKTAANFFDGVKVGVHIYEWNVFNDILIYIAVCVLVVKLRKTLS